jgi:hypothetical protein
MVIEPEGSTLPTPKPAIRNDPKPVPSTFQLHNLFPRFILPSPCWYSK